MRPPKIQVDTRDPRPLWRQIEDELLRAITTGELSVGDPVPSVRDLARQLRVNPNTVAKAYQRLGESRVLAVRRGEGTYVQGSPRPLPARERSRQLVSLARRFEKHARLLGADSDEIADALAQVLERPVPESVE